MNKKTGFGLLGGGVLVILLGVAYLLRPTAEASKAIEALPLEDSIVSASEELSPEAETQPDVSNTPEATPHEAAIEKSEESNFEGLVIYQIIQDRSEVRFSLDEILRGNPFTPVGKTNQVAGEIGVDFSNPSASQLGTILINARTLQTDSSNRDRAIKNQILDSNEFEYIRFEPSNITGFPAEIVFGEVVDLKVSGNLTIRNITQLITFDVSVILISETEMEGSATAILLRSDFDLKIPAVQGVAEVSDEVLLEIEFYANSE